ncbi:MAG: MurR/RpiR family transcriptional regulator [Chloroflexi bacterium]|nr:MAG: MurR/RpiR family transcriptional regulator [Chloroflexota bacterium]
MAFKEVVTQHDGRLTPTDKQIAQELLSDPAKMAFLPAAEIAERVGVHESTVIRLAQKLGYSGYRALRADLQAEISPAGRIRRRLEHAPQLVNLVADEIAALNEMINTISQEQLEEAAQILIKSQRVFLFAQGHATSLLEFMDRRLRRSGFNTVVLKSQGRDLAEHLLTLNAQDAVLAFTFYAQPPGLSTLLDVAQETGAPSILISDTLGPLIRPAPDILLWARRGAEDQFLTLTVPMVICNTLILTIARLDEGRSLESLERLTGLISRFHHEDTEARNTPEKL